MKNSFIKPGTKKTCPIQFSDDDELLDIRFDHIFKAVFTKKTPASKGALSGLISDLIRQKVIIESIQTNEPPVENAFDKRIRFDITCKAESGELVNIEMSYYPESHEPIRLEYYASRQFAGQYIHGTSRDYFNLAETYQISIIGKTRFFPDKSLVHTFMYHDSENGISLGGRSRIITVELSKTNMVVNKPIDEMDSGEMWSIFFQYLTNKKKRATINEIIKAKEEIAMAGETLIHISRDEIEQARLTTLMKNKLDYQSGMVSAERRGIKKGRLEGHKEGIKEGLLEGRDEAMKTFAKNALAKGLSPENICEITGLDLETINSLK